MSYRDQGAVVPSRNSLCVVYILFYFILFWQCFALISIVVMSALEKFGFPDAVVRECMLLSLSPGRCTASAVAHIIEIIEEFGQYASQLCKVMGHQGVFSLARDSAVPSSMQYTLRRVTFFLSYTAAATSLQCEKRTLLRVYILQCSLRT